MTQSGDQHQPKTGLLAVLWALGRLIVESLRRGFISRDVQHHVADLEAHYALELFGGRQRRNPDFQALSLDEQRRRRRLILADYFKLRRLRHALHRITTHRGCNHLPNSFETFIHGQERRVSSRRVLRLAAIRLPRVSATSEPLAGAPP